MLNSTLEIQDCILGLICGQCESRKGPVTQHSLRTSPRRRVTLNCVLKAVRKIKKTSRVHTGLDMDEGKDPVANFRVVPVSGTLTELLALKVKI